MEIRAKRFGEVLNEWFRILGKSWKPLLLTSLVAHLPLAAAVGVLFWVTGAGKAFEVVLDPESYEDLPYQEFIEIFEPFLWSSTVWLALQLLAGVFVYLAAARVVAEYVAARPSDWRGVAGFAWRRLAKGVVSSLVVVGLVVVLVAVAVGLGWVLISAFEVNFLTVFVTTTMALTTLVVLIWITVSMAFATDVIAMEDAGPITALTRSFTLVQRRWWVTVGYTLLVGLIGSTVSQVVSTPLVPVFLVGFAYPELIALGLALSALLQGPLLAALAAAYAVWYVDLRVRREPVVSQQLI